MTIDIIHDIPTAHYFKKKMGRTGIYATLKRRNSLIDQIYYALKRTEAFRAVLSMETIVRLRTVRRACNEILIGYDNCSKREEADITDLKEALDRRIDAIATHLFGAHKEQNIQDLNHQVEFNGFYDKVALQGKNAGRALDNHYRYERAASRHFGEGKIKNWLDSSSQLTLSVWAGTVRKWADEDGNLDGVASAGEPGVLYLDETGRQAYRVRFTGGLARDSNGDLFHTGNLFSSHAGHGWGIFVMDFNGNIYIHEHKVNRFHHSSFFSGAPVLAGGEIAINSGRVIGVTNKTGHYKARPEELDAVLSRLVLQHFVDLSNVAVNDPFNTPDKWFRAMDAIQAKGKLSDLPDAQIIAKPAPIPK